MGKSIIEIPHLTKTVTNPSWGTLSGSKEPEKRSGRNELKKRNFKWRKFHKAYNLEHSARFNLIFQMIKEKRKERDLTLFS